MLDNIVDQLITVGVGLAILAGSYLVWLFSGIANVIFTEGRKWSWKRMFEDVVKAILMSVAILSWVVIINALDWFSTKMGADISKILDGASVTGLIGGIIGGTAYFAVKGYRNFYDFINKNHTQPKIEEGAQDYKSVAEEVRSIFETRPEVVVTQLKEEVSDRDPLLGGLGQYYSVPIGDYDSFRSAVIGEGFDIDDVWGYQCWDGAALLWQQLGRWLLTGDGSARGCWVLEKEENAGTQFDLIYNKEDVRRGDVVVFGFGTYGHIGYADEDYNGSGVLKVLGQNQNPDDMRFCVVNVKMDQFLGAFRFKEWSKTPAPAPEPEPSYIEYTYKEGDTFGQVITDLGLRTSHGLWGPDGDVAYYTNELNIDGNIPVGTKLSFWRRAD